MFNQAGYLRDSRTKNPLATYHEPENSFAEYPRGGGIVSVGSTLHNRERDLGNV